ncbi:MAG: hypothetical protein JXB32_24345 [Deltaproteobacteria bacterium]|nr:hypothetical protein [Deltaproteobacteria bacterium]
MMHEPTTTKRTASDDDPTTTHGGMRVRETIRRHAEVLRHPDGFPPKLVFAALAYLYAAYALGSRTAQAELSAHLRRYRRAVPPSAELALGLARGFRKLADEAS